MLKTMRGLPSCFARAGRDYSVALHGTGIAGAAKSAAPKKAKKNARHIQKYMTGEVLLDAHQFGTLVITNPNLLRSGIADAEVMTFQEI